MMNQLWVNIDNDTPFRRYFPSKDFNLVCSTPSTDWRRFSFSERDRNLTMEMTVDREGIIGVVLMRFRLHEFTNLSSAFKDMDINHESTCKELRNQYDLLIILAGT